MGSVRRRGGGIRVDLESAEVVLLASLVEQVRELLTIASHDDPVVARLLPDAYRDDPESAAEYRELMESDLRAQKAAALQRVLDDLSNTGKPHGNGERFELADDAVTPWLYALTDVRLTLGTTLDVSEDWADQLASLDPDSPRRTSFAIYDWLSWLQTMIIEAASEGG
jgi:glutathione S-transferase